VCVCVCVFVCLCVRACMRACVRACERAEGGVVCVCVCLCVYVGGWVGGCVRAKRARMYARAHEHMGIPKTVPDGRSLAAKRPSPAPALYEHIMHVEQWHRTPREPCMPPPAHAPVMLDSLTITSAGATPRLPAGRVRRTYE